MGREEAVSSRVGQVWRLNDGESVELVVDVKEPSGLCGETRWITLVLWSEDHDGGDPYTLDREPGSLDQIGEGAFVNAEKSNNPGYADWSRIA